jgi:hypothetical protein
MTPLELRSALRERRSLLDRQQGQAEALEYRIGQANSKVAELNLARETQRVAATVLTAFAQEAQETTQHQIEGLVTRALQVVFGENLSFHMIPGERGSQATLEFVLRTTIKSPKGDLDSSVEFVDTPVMDARGGGMAAVVGFVLRLVVLLLTPGARKVLVLDESFAHVSASYETRVAEFLREVADQAGVQLILVTHSTAYSDLADVRYRITQGLDGVSIIHEGETE